MVKLVTDKVLQPGDVLIGNYDPHKVSTWTVTEVLSKRPASLPGKTYYEINADWTNKSIMSFKGENLDETSWGFRKYVEDAKAVKPDSKKTDPQTV